MPEGSLIRSFRYRCFANPKHLWSRHAMNPAEDDLKSVCPFCGSMADREEERIDVAPAA